MKDIKNYEGVYQVTENGDVWSVRRNRFLKLYKNQLGYLHICLYKNNKQKSFYVHRLVAEAFLPNPDNLPCVNHKDEDKTNNNVKNLEWCSFSYNNSYGTRIERVSEKNTNGKRSKPVLQYTLDGQLIREWPSARQAERESGFNYGAVAACCRGELKKYKGFIWKYK